jgi:lysophospholipase L1-like esterase
MNSTKEFGFIFQFFRSLIVFIVAGAVSLCGLEYYVDKIAWPIAESWYRLESVDGQVHFGCQNFRPIVFSELPSSNVTRILVIGGSTVFGYPMRLNGTDLISLSERGVVGTMQRALDASWPDQFELINLGINGGGSEDMLRIMRRSKGWGASGIIIYDGHNEFLNLPAHFNATLWKSALYRRFSIVADRVMVSPGWIAPPAHQSQKHESVILSEFEENLKAVIALAQEQNLPVVIATQSSNLSGVDPNWSTIGKEEVIKGVAELSLEDLEREWMQEPDSADIAWRLGRKREASGGTAWDPYQSSIDNDGLRLRADSGINKVIRNVADSTGATLVESEEQFRRHGVIPDNTLFYDWVHPKPRGAEIIAESLLEGMVKSGMITDRPLIKAIDLTDDDKIEVELRVARSWLQWACIRKHDPHWRLTISRSYAMSVIERDPENEEAAAIILLTDVLSGKNSDLTKIAGTMDQELINKMALLHPVIAELFNTEQP